MSKIFLFIFSAKKKVSEIGRTHLINKPRNHQLYASFFIEAIFIFAFWHDPSEYSEPASWARKRSIEI
jgi:hypothetical protein